MNGMILFFGFVFGATIGSFLNVCIYRIPQEGSIVSPSSHCPHCGTPIHFYDNIPLLSFILLRGRCRACNAPISFRYPLVELLTGIFSITLLLRYGISPLYLVYFAFFASLTVVSFIDFSHKVIPDVISLPGILAGLAISWFHPQMSFKDSLIGVLLGGGALYLVASGYHLVTKREGMGGGDIKLLAMIGAFIGWKGVLFTILCSSLVGAVVGVTLMLVSSEADSKYAVPFGPFLSLGGIIYIFWGEALINWYLGFLQGIAG
ncbi:MAG: prepilin peptidase [Deltaproteobacteria bacterium]|nr:prepilin peptidase [Deltaproteobacteria bacterium]